MIPLAYDKLSPIRVQMGYLRSEIREGVAKFFCQSHRDTYELLNSRQEYLSTFLQIVKQKENFILREKIQRDTWVNRCIEKARSQTIVNQDA